jgi:four helix bundle protein
MRDGAGIVNSEELKKRTRAFALRVLRVVESLPRTWRAETIGRQLLRSATSVGANYRAACRARTRAEFVAKMGIVEEEADESAYWMEILQESGLVRKDRLDGVKAEANELVAIMVASIKTARIRAR